MYYQCFGNHVCFVMLIYKKSKNGKETFYGVPLNPPDWFWQAPSLSIALCLSQFVPYLHDERGVYLSKNVAFGGILQGPNLIPFAQSGSTKWTLISGTCSSLHNRAAQVHSSSPRSCKPWCSPSALERKMCAVTCTTLVVNVIFHVPWQFPILVFS